MIRAWRIDKAKRSQAESFSGEGARLYPGRWNSGARRLVYTASSLSLAALEKFVHMGEDGRNIRFASYEIEIPDRVNVARWGISDLPPNWDIHPASGVTQAKGDAWLASNASAVLILPSVVTPGEANILLNPEHGDFQYLRISNAAPFSFDPRLWKKSG